ncbi:hypothetical protein PbB2_01813 [Candidatus Phycosocius bacilliformis]|uniref:HPP transmembrane region domain-containing protein n=1 Tax=Candidatus Phycosocius bacilliformis TaxID=1445552 RepID=A0A2P2EAR6_9PROT|nr:HPP family protein [Candidatus Phycosocius bacilliformis]GBF58142.1 hypothetical protein PbB2_01813 [Candidatus Phycosocius bacilliformis]
MALSSLIRTGRARLPAWKPALGAGIAIGFLALMHDYGVLAYLIAPLGASATLVWMLPKSPLARARAVVGGSLVSAIVGFLILGLAHVSPLSLGLAVGLAILAMALLDLLHAPAGALPLVIATHHPEPLPFLATLVVSTVALVLLGIAYQYLAQPKSSAPQSP